jgi:hypothetical protein
MTRPSRSLAGRAEMRASFAKLDANGRRAALEDVRVREAVLEMPGYVSCMSKTEHDTLYRVERESKFANELKVSRMPATRSCK